MKGKSLFFKGVLNKNDGRLEMRKVKLTATSKGMYTKACKHSESRKIEEDAALKLSEVKIEIVANKAAAKKKKK